MKIAILSGSIRRERESFKVALMLEDFLFQRGIQAMLIDLVEYKIPLFGSIGEDEEGIEAVRGILQGADAIIFVTPEYHGSFSGVLKNTIDHFCDEFKNKPIGVATASLEKFGGLNASTQLQHVILSLGAFPLPYKLIVPRVHQVFDEALEITNESVMKSVKKFLDEFLWFTSALISAKRNVETVVNEQ